MTAAAPLGPPSVRLRDAYDAERFRRDGHRLIDALADRLAAANGRDDAPVLPWCEPAAQRAAWVLEPPDEVAAGDASAIFDEVLQRALDGSIRLHHPRYLGHQVTPPLPGAALVDLASALLNNGMAIYEMGPTATAIELAVIAWLARQLGLPAAGAAGGAGAGGVLTSGGSLGNLTALLAARQARAGFDVWAAGDAGGPPLSVVCSTTAHYSVARALRVMGWGAGGALAAPVDARFRLRPEAIAAVVARARDAGRRPIAVVAAAGATATGAYDPLSEIADVCAELGLWLHVDGAHGAAAALSPRHRHLVAGIERADSVVWDAHKLMMMPALVTAVLFRDGRRSYEAFAQEASYLFADGESFDIGLRTLECTKRMMGAKLYVTLCSGGEALFRDYVERVFALGAALAAKIEAAPDMELAVPPDGNIVCWRYRPSGAGGDGEALDALQAAVRRRALERGRYYFLQTRLGDRLYLRSALMNPLTEDVDLDGVLDEIRLVAGELVKS